MITTKDFEIIDLYKALIKFPILKKKIPTYLLDDLILEINGRKIYLKNDLNMIGVVKLDNTEVDITEIEAIKIVNRFLQKRSNVKIQKLFLDFPLYIPSITVITGLNGTYKSSLCLKLLQNLKDFKKVYICNEDYTIQYRLNISEDIAFFYENNPEEVLEIIKNFDIIVIDSINMFKLNLLDMENFIKDIALNYVNENKLIIIISHQLKTVKVNNVLTDSNKASIYTTYTSSLINICDVALSLNSKDNKIKINIEKNRFENNIVYLDTLKKEYFNDLFKTSNIIKSNITLTELFEGGVNNE